MDLVNVLEVVAPHTEAERPSWQPGDSYVAGGTWLFSEPQPEVRRLIDLSNLSYTPIEEIGDELLIAGGCSYRELQGEGYRLADAASLTERAIRTLSSSFKTWGVATVGGNLCLAYPKSMMAPLFTLLGAHYELLTPGGPVRMVPAREFQVGAQETIRRDGEYLRRIRIPRLALRGRFAHQKLSYTATSHATAMIMGRIGPAPARANPSPGGGAEESRNGQHRTARLVASAATVRPVAIDLDPDLDEESVVAAVAAATAPVAVLSDGHGGEEYRREMLLYLSRLAWADLRAGGDL